MGISHHGPRLVWPLISRPKIRRLHSLHACHKIHPTYACHNTTLPPPANKLTTPSNSSVSCRAASARCAAAGPAAAAPGGSAAGDMLPSGDAVPPLAPPLPTAGRALRMRASLQRQTALEQRFGVALVWEGPAAGYPLLTRYVLCRRTAPMFPPTCVQPARHTNVHPKTAPNCQLPTTTHITEVSPAGAARKRSPQPALGSRGAAAAAAAAALWAAIPRRSSPAAAVAAAACVVLAVGCSRESQAGGCSCKGIVAQ